ncbi:hypothetical protein AURDEDRAFT_187517 [Auricularia subglabra TFB-10046 SS5]|uniref:Ricin B lectin domain-containing protein n=1 Tax=Auricularia subglabra (strain TFB-10046 / SS5) TaxID=717982 RepID=J0DBS0_AURST|nr:hypothetical protein AURDEDRAFT_187517 [Auricularia subglabra TFB-10046 SS5]
MRSVAFLGLCAASVTRAAVTSGLYRISSNFFPQYVITQSGTNIAAYGAYGYPEQVWSLIVSSANATASIQNLQTADFIAVADGSIVPRAYPFRWRITPGSTSAAQIASGSRAVAVPQGEGQLVLVAPDGGKTQSWTFVATVPLPHAYKVWNEELGLYLDHVGDAVIGTPASSASTQIWHISGTFAGGGLPTLQNAATDAFLTVDGTQAAVGADAFTWSHAFVGGQMTLHTDDSTLTISADGKVILSPDLGTQQNQTWVFIPVSGA